MLKDLDFLRFISCVEELDVGNISPTAFWNLKQRMKFRQKGWKLWKKQQMDSKFAEEDLKLRNSGEILGTRQSGVSDMLLRIL